jgi:hypothetical protein
MIAVLWCAALFASMQLAIKDDPEWNVRYILITLGVVTGAIAQQRWEGRFLLGGLIGGMVVYIGFIVIVYVLAAPYLIIMIGLAVGFPVWYMVLLNTAVRQKRGNGEEPGEDAPPS